MADRGRDLEFSILTNLDHFNVEKAASGLDDLARSGKRTEDHLDDLARHLERTGTSVRAVGDDTKHTGTDLEQFARDAKTTATRIDSAFDAISKSSRSNIRTKVADDVGHAKRKFSEVKDEAFSTAREMFASFTDTSSITQAAQEISANVGGLFGPIGLAIGGALSAGIALFTADVDRMREEVSTIVDDMLNNAGRLSEAFIDSKLKEWAKDGTLTDLKSQADAAGVSFHDLARALAGDEDALTRVNAQVDAAAAKQIAMGDAIFGAGNHVTILDGKLAGIEESLAGVKRANDLAREATANYATAASTATSQAADATDASNRRLVDSGRKTRRDLEAIFEDPIVQKVIIERQVTQTAARIKAQEARLRW